MNAPKTLDTRPPAALLTAAEVCAALRIGRSTLYRTRFLMARAVRVGPSRRGVRWEPATLELYKALNSAATLNPERAA